MMLAKKPMVEITNRFTREYKIAINPKTILIRYNNKTVFLGDSPKVTS